MLWDIFGEIHQYIRGRKCEKTHGYPLSVAVRRTGSPASFLNPSNENSIVMHDCNEAEIAEIILELNSAKASDIPIRIIKKSSHIISKTLSEYYTILMQDGIFPDSLKQGKISPIFKKETQSY